MMMNDRWSCCLRPQFRQCNTISQGTTDHAVSLDDAVLNLCDVRSVKRLGTRERLSDHPVV